MRGSFLYRVNRPVFSPSLKVLSLPFAVIAIYSVYSLIVALTELALVIRYGKTHLSSLSIKESLDTLPAGICFFEESGLVRLVNKKMIKLCALATGKAFLNGVKFWIDLRSGYLKNGCVLIKDEVEPIIEFSNGEIISFSKFSRKLKGKKIYEIVATDVTEKYLLTKQAERKFEELKTINKRLISYSETVAEVTREKEILATKMRIHDDIGGLLLTTKRKLSKEITKEERQDLINFWKAEIIALNSIKNQKKKHNLQVIFDVAKLVGVTVNYVGNYPKADGKVEKILVSAMHECLTNTVSHANGKNLNVYFTENADGYNIEITNDGIKPQGKIKEGGGLTGLRTLVEREKGKMIIYHNPEFKLCIELYKGENL